MTSLHHLHHCVEPLVYYYYRLLPSANRAIAPLFLNSMVFWHKTYVRIRKKICIFKIQIKSKYILILIFTTVMINERRSKILNYSNYSKVASHWCLRWFPWKRCAIQIFFKLGTIVIYYRTVKTCNIKMGSPCLFSPCARLILRVS